MTQTIKKFGVGSIAFAALMLLVLPLSFAKADGFDIGDGGGDYGWDTTGYTDYSQPAADNYSWDTTGYTDYAQPAADNYSWDTTGYTDYETPTYSTPSYTTGGYSTGGYSTGGYSGSGYMIGGGYRTPVYNTPVVTTPSNTNICSNGSNLCNTTITNPAPVINNNNVVVTTPAPVQPVQQYCAYGYSGTYPNCYLPQPIVYSQPVQIPVAYNNTPYVSLSQVPYTGLDLGFWGSIAYWGAFVLFALFAAYLIAIKRVQNTIAAYLKSVLFGTDEEVEVETTTDTEPTQAPAPALVATTNGDMIDSFIMSQINRARA